VLIEQTDQEPRQARLRLSSLSQEDQVLPGDDRVLERGRTVSS